MSTITFVTDYAKRERQQLADLLLRLGPDEPTLCAGWTTRDLAAHLVVRERRPDASFGMILPPLRDHGERVRRAVAGRDFPDIVAMVRKPPVWSPISNPLTDELFNGAEFFIHHEDVRRGRPGWEPRSLPRGQAAALWRATRFTGRLVLRRVGFPVRVVADDGGELIVGENPEITIDAPAGEIALFLSGRQRAARVALDGPRDQVDQLINARFGLA